MKNTSTARARTVAHMQKLVATATAAASAGASCSPTDNVKTVTITPLPQPTVTSDPTIARPAPTDSATLTPPTPPPPPPDPSGYLVVDMLPAPARCLGVAAASKVTGKFRRDAAGIMLDLVVTLGNAKLTGAAPTAWSGQVVSSSFRAQNTVGVARVNPQQGVNGMGISFQVICATSQQGSLGVNVSFNTPVADGMVPTLSLYDF